jgi:hypothetical protein
LTEKLPAVHPSTVLFALGLALLSSPSGATVLPPDQFAGAYRAFVTFDEGRCYFWLTDVGLDVSQFRQSLRSGYEADRGLEILTRSEIPVKCFALARRVARKAGFRKIRTRAATSTEYSRAIP